MTWITSKCWVCDHCGEDWAFSVKPIFDQRRRSKALRPSRAARRVIGGYIGTTYLHYCSPDCVEQADAGEVRYALRPRKARIEDLG